MLPTSKLSSTTTSKSESLTSQSLTPEIVTKFLTEKGLMSEFKAYLKAATKSSETDEKTSPVKTQSKALYKIKGSAMERFNQTQVFESVMMNFFD